MRSTNKTQFWMRPAKTLEDQAALPVVNSVEMGQPSLEAAIARIGAIGEYQQAFRSLGRPLNGSDLVRAIASYERTLVSFNSPLIASSPATKNAIDDAAKRAGSLQHPCPLHKCHGADGDQRDVTFFMDNDFHNIGIGIIRHNVRTLARPAEQLIKSGDTAAIDRAAIQTTCRRLPLSHHQERVRYRVHSNAGAAQCTGDGALLSRRFRK